MHVKLPHFEELVSLAKSDPQKLENLRQHAIESLIASAPAETRRRLRGLQFQIDMEIRRGKTPLQRCMKISDMMLASCQKLGAALKGESKKNTSSFATVVSLASIPSIKEA